MTRVLPSSPNWYCSKIVTVLDEEILFYGARCDLNILQIASPGDSRNGKQRLNINRPGRGIGCQTKSKSSSARAEECAKPNGTFLGDGLAHSRCTTREDESLNYNNNNPDAAEGSLVDPLHIQQQYEYSSDGIVNHNRNDDTPDDSHAADRGNNTIENSEPDCVFVATITRLHKERITTVCGFKSVAADGRSIFSIFTGADDGKVKLHSISWAGNGFGKLHAVKTEYRAVHELPTNVILPIKYK